MVAIENLNFRRGLVLDVIGFGGSALLEDLVGFVCIGSFVFGCCCHSFTLVCVICFYRVVGICGVWCVYVVVVSKWFVCLLMVSLLIICHASFFDLAGSFSC